MPERQMFDGFYKGKSVLLTGHTGFKGSWLALWLHEMGAQVTGLGKSGDMTRIRQNSVSCPQNSKGVHRETFEKCPHFVIPTKVGI